MPSKQPITQELARQLLSYDAETGRFTWNVGRGRFGNAVKPGDIAGYECGDGYRAIWIDGRGIKEHRLAWLWVHGSLPAQIDHVNGNRSDNRIANLRPADARLNNENKRSANSNNRSSGLLGVTAEAGRWIAQIGVNGKLHRIGRYDSPEAASAAYVDAKRKLHCGCTI